MKKYVMFAAALLVSACIGTSKPSQFYTLKAIAADKVVSSTSVSIGVEEARVARYLDKPQIVLAEDSGVELRISELNRWAEPLSSLIQRTLVEDLTTLLPKATVKERTQAREKFDYVVLIEINQMNGLFDQQAQLSGWYSVMNTAGEIVARRPVLVTAPMGDTYADYVTAQSLLVQKMAQNLAGEIVRLNTQKK